MRPDCWRPTGQSAVLRETVSCYWWNCSSTNPSIPFTIMEDGNIHIKDKFREGTAAYFLKSDDSSSSISTTLTRA